MNDSDEFLEHFGVKGMKWGKRKARSAPTQTRPQPRTTQPQSADTKKKMSTGKKIAAGLLVGAGAVAIGAAVRSNQHKKGKASMDSFLMPRKPYGAQHQILNNLETHKSRLGVNEQNVRTVSNIRRSTPKTMKELMGDNYPGRIGDNPRRPRGK